MTVLFFLSGATGLVFQVVFTRLLQYVFGSTAFAASTVLASFMGGMALGSALLGRLAAAESTEPRPKLLLRPAGGGELAAA